MPSALAALAAEVRRELVACVSRTGGHLGPNLGVVELTIAIHRVFDSPRDTLIWDTGHQAYVHKLLTGRHDGWERLKLTGGPVGLPQPGREPARPRREQPRLHVAVLGRRHRARLRAHRAAPPRRRRDRRRRAHRRHGLGGAEQHRRGEGPQPRHRRQRQRPLLRPDDRRRGRPAGVAAAAARLRARAGEGQAGAQPHPGGRRPAVRGAARAQGGREGRARARRSCSPTWASSTSGRSTATTWPRSSPRCAARGASAAR